MTSSRSLIFGGEIPSALERVTLRGRARTRGLVSRVRIVPHDPLLVVNLTILQLRIAGVEVFGWGLDGALFAHGGMGTGAAAWLGNHDAGCRAWSVEVDDELELELRSERVGRLAVVLELATRRPDMESDASPTPAVDVSPDAG